MMLPLRGVAVSESKTGKAGALWKTVSLPSILRALLAISLPGASQKQLKAFRRRDDPACDHSD